MAYTRHGRHILGTSALPGRTEFILPICEGLPNCGDCIEDIVEALKGCSPNTIREAIGLMAHPEGAIRSLEPQPPLPVFKKAPPKDERAALEIAAMMDDLIAGALRNPRIRDYVDAKLAEARARNIILQMGEIVFDFDENKAEIRFNKVEDEGDNASPVDAIRSLEPQPPLPVFKKRMSVEDWEEGREIAAMMDELTKTQKVLNDYNDLLNNEQMIKDAFKRAEEE